VSRSHYDVNLADDVRGEVAGQGRIRLFGSHTGGLMHEYAASA
jgi:hypothetical protein